MSDSIAAQMPDLVPFVTTLGVEVLSVTDHLALLRLPDDPRLHNHLERLHAGAAFTLAESATGALVLHHFGHLLERVTPVVVRAEMQYRRPATGDVVAEAVPDGDLGAAVIDASRGERVQLVLSVRLVDSADQHVATAQFEWVMLSRRPDDRFRTATGQG